MLIIHSRIIHLPFSLTADWDGYSSAISKIYLLHLQSSNPHTPGRHQYIVDARIIITNKLKRPRNVNAHALKGFRCIDLIQEDNCDSLTATGLDNNGDRSCDCESSSADCSGSIINNDRTLTDGMRLALNNNINAISL